MKPVAHIFVLPMGQLKFKSTFTLISQSIERICTGTSQLEISRPLCLNFRTSVRGISIQNPVYALPYSTPSRLTAAAARMYRMSPMQSPAPVFHCIRQDLNLYISPPLFRENNGKRSIVPKVDNKEDTINEVPIWFRGIDLFIRFPVES